MEWYLIDFSFSYQMGSVADSCGRRKRNLTIRDFGTVFAPLGEYCKSNVNSVLSDLDEAVQAKAAVAKAADADEVIVSF